MKYEDYIAHCVPYIMARDEARQPRFGTVELTSAPTAASVRAEIEEDNERDRIATALATFGDEDPLEYDDGSVIIFSREVPDRNNSGETLTLRYAFIRSGGRYYGTGVQTPQRATWSTLVDFIIDLGVPFDAVSVLVVADSAPLEAWV